jgi:hypothetical protein
MKKFLISMLTVAISVMMLASVFGCNKKPATSSATVYDLVAEGTSYYFIITDITVDKGGAVKDIKIDEILLTDRWTRQGGENKAITDTVIATIPASGTRPASEAIFAKYISIGDKKFEITSISGDNTAYPSPVYAEIGGDVDNLITDMKENKDLKKLYYEEAAKGNFKILKKVGDNYEVEYDGGNNSYTDLYKSKSNYWTGTQYPLGWKGNIAKMESYVKANGVKYTLGDLDGIEADAETKEFYIGDVNTGATLTGFAGYMSVVKAAYDQAMKVYA